VILVIAGHGTAGAVRRLLRTRGRAAVSVLAPAALSVPGWAHDPEHPAGDRIVLDGQVRRPDELTGVLTALDMVLPGDLPHVTAADQGFAAAEMTAFLRDWLATLPGPVIDRPTTLALSGRAGDRAAWSAAAAALGVTERLGAAVPVSHLSTVTVAAGRVIGPAPPARRPVAGRTGAADPGAPLGPVAVKLAAAAGVTAARLLFSTEADEPVLIGALPWWHVLSPLVLRALLDHIAEGATGGARP
jgi:hypothetical protein